MTSQGEPCRVPPTSRRSAAPAERGTSRRELRAGFASLTPSGTESSPWRRRDARRPEGSVGRGWSRSSRQSRETCRVPPTSRRSAARAERGTSRRELRAGFASLTPPERKAALGGGETPGGQKEAWVAAGARPAAKVAKRGGSPYGALLTGACRLQFLEW